MSQVLARPGVRALLDEWQRDVVCDVARGVLDELRRSLRQGQSLPDLPASGVDEDFLLHLTEDRLRCGMEELGRPHLRRVVNATGVLLHTNLGRARLSTQAAAEAARAATEAVSLEVDLETGRRGRRAARVERLVALLTGASRTVVVNNGAAALWLAVRALAARGGRVLVSRGEQVAIGGSFRMPELLRTTGARMVDVGTTNRTTVEDYAAELRDGDLLLKVHPSNYRVVGFHEEASVEALADLSRERGARLIYDAGSGSLVDSSRYGLRGEATVAACLDAGAAVVTFSGDKLLGGPQAGLAVGEADSVERMAKHPLMRALRVDKMVLASLEATLLAYARRGGSPAPALPFYEALEVGEPELRRRAQRLAEDLASTRPRGWRIEPRSSRASVGGGSFADQSLESWEVGLVAPTERAALRLHQALRRAEPAVYTRIDGCEVGLDLRAVPETEIEILGRQVGAQWSRSQEPSVRMRQGEEGR